MTDTRTALADLARLSVALERRAGLPDTSLCQQQADALSDHGAVAATPDRNVLEQLRAELKAACAAGNLDTLPRRTLRRAPLVFWDRDPQAAGFPGLVDAVLDGAATQPRWLRELIEAWLRDFGPDRIRLPEVGRAVAQMLPGCPDPRMVPWAYAQRRFSLFEAEQGPARVGRALLDGPEPLEDVLAQTGMSDQLRAEGRFFHAAIGGLLDALPMALRSPGATKAWQRACSILEVETVSRDAKTGRDRAVPTLRAPELLDRTVRACLDPWLQGSPVAAPKKGVEAFLVRTVGDPRLRPDRWNRVGDAYARLMRAWLADASLEAFFTLISATTNDERWPFRRAFWRACLRRLAARQTPAEVWVVLGPDMAARAGAMPDLRGQHGNLSGSNQAVLLMRFGEMVLSEWSDIGPVRAWDTKDPRAPRLYERNYAAHELKREGLYFPEQGHHELDKSGWPLGPGLAHRYPEREWWQLRAAAMLRNKLGLQLEASEYMP